MEKVGRFLPSPPLCVATPLFKKLCALQDRSILLLSFPASLFVSNPTSPSPRLECFHGKAITTSVQKPTFFIAPPSLYFFNLPFPPKRSSIGRSCNLFRGKKRSIPLPHPPPPFSLDYKKTREFRENVISR